jgi:hypothetical protein
MEPWRIPQWTAAHEYAVVRYKSQKEGIRQVEVVVVGNDNNLTVATHPSTGEVKPYSLTLDPQRQKEVGDLELEFVGDWRFVRPEELAPKK